MVLLMEQRRGKTTKEIPEENNTKKSRVKFLPTMKHNKRNWNHFIGIETYTIMSKAQQMVQYDHEVLPPSFWTIEGKKKEEKPKKKM